MIYLLKFSAFKRTEVDKKLTQPTFRLISPLYMRRK